MPVCLFRSESNNPYLNLALEEYLLTDYPKKDQDIYLVFYENKDSVILGRNLEYEKEVYPHKDHPPVLRRISGGGSVVHFPGNLNYGLIVNTGTHPEFRLIRDSYDIILGIVSRALEKSFGGKIRVAPGGISDLCMINSGGNKKISGNSQARKRDWLLHHGTVLYSAANLSHISYYLKHPPKEPDYRQGKKHRDFMIRHIPKQPPSRIIRIIAREFSAHFSQTVQIKTINHNLLNRVREYHSHATDRLRVTTSEISGG